MSKRPVTLDMKIVREMPRGRLVDLIEKLAHQLADEQGSRSLLEAELKEAKADSARLEELELALKEGDVAYVTASDMIEPGKWEHIEIEFDSDRNPVSRERLAEAIDEAMEEPEDWSPDGLDR